MSIVRTDAKRRITLPESQPGEVYEVINEDSGQYSLIRLVTPPPKKRPRKRSEVEQAMKKAPLKPAMTWEELRQLTREK